MGISSALIHEQFCWSLYESPTCLLFGYNFAKFLSHETCTCFIMIHETFLVLHQKTTMHRKHINTRKTRCVFPEYMCRPGMDMPGRCRIMSSIPCSRQVRVFTSVKRDIFKRVIFLKVAVSVTLL